MAGGIVTTNIEAFATGAIAAWKAEFARRYSYYGYSQGTVI